MDNLDIEHLRQCRVSHPGPTTGRGRPRSKCEIPWSHREVPSLTSPCSGSLSFSRSTTIPPISPPSITENFLPPLLSSLSSKKSYPSYSSFGQYLPWNWQGPILQMVSHCLPLSLPVSSVLLTHILFSEFVLLLTDRRQNLSICAFKSLTFSILRNGLVSSPPTFRFLSLSHKSLELNQLWSYIQPDYPSSISAEMWWGIRWDGNCNESLTR